MEMIFSRVKNLEKEIETYLVTIQRAGMVFLEAVNEYLAEDMNSFLNRVVDIKTLESQADDLRVEIEHKLYSNMLIPDSRGDVLGLLETLDDVIDVIEDMLIALDIETPVIPKELHESFAKMCDYTKKATDELVKASRSFFTNFHATNNYINRVSFYESEVDRVEEKLKREIFQGESVEVFSHKLHLRYFTEKIAMISDAAEAVCSRLAISVIKRTI